MVIPSVLVEMGHHALDLEAPLSMGWSLGLWSNGGEAMNDLRGKGSQGIRRQHNNMQGKSCLRVTPTPPFIAFLGIFRVLSPW